MATITCKYSCAVCGLTDVAVEVQGRKKLQEVTEWVEKVMIVALARDHARRRPWCQPKTLTQVKIPYFGGNVGEAVHNGAVN